MKRLVAVMVGVLVGVNELLTLIVGVIVCVKLFDGVIVAV